MKVKELTVCNLRNLAKQTVRPNDKLNIFTGDNAQGKTNLVESVYLCCIGKSPRTDKDKDMICWGKDYAYVKVKYACRFGEGEIYVALRSDAKKQIAVNSVPIARMGELMGYLNCIYFSPNEIKIISQSPVERRRFLDIDLCQTDKNYFYSLSRFNKALAQRNNLLKQPNNPDELKETLFVWNEQIAEEGAKVIFKRKTFCEKLKIHAKQCHLTLSDGKEDLSLDYVTQIKGESVKEITENYLRQLRESTEKDILLRYTTAGCQRDDISLKINGVDVRTFGSQGQLRTTALSLKLAELKIFKELIGEYPVLILDDVLSELDADRQKRLLNFDADLQILLTTATPADKALISTDCKYFTIKNGVCKDNA
ncbi:MAG: DNA replication/repair protein RecF [Corallococcus sp.]|nr:DNA replication/repair protein RecF [Bacillota bacterium]MCM1533316.1 DNA replication/repair protein RecF [Corallococcus sp.]